MRVRKMTFLNVAKDASSLAFASLIQQCYWGKSLLLDGRKVNRNRKIFIVAGASSPLFGVSWLKIEPKVSIFPVISAILADITHAIEKSLSHLDMSL